MSRESAAMKRLRVTRIMRGLCLECNVLALPGRSRCYYHLFVDRLKKCNTNGLNVFRE